jgi:small-conductance mechanosensitive channel
MLSSLQEWPGWLVSLAETVITIGIAWITGLLINRIVITRLVRLASRTRGQWDDVVSEEIKRRVTWWAILAGAWLSLGYWPLDPSWRTFASGAIVAIAGLSATLAASAIATRLVAHYGPRVAPSVPAVGLTQNLTRLIVFVIGALVILNSLGLSITPMLAALGVGGLAVALALQEPLSNLFAGIFLSVAGQTRVGDYVKLDSGLEGYVADVNWRATRIRMLSGSVIIVPNSKLSQAIVTIVSGRRMPNTDIPVAVDVGVGPARDLDQLEAVTLDVARDVMRGVPGGVPDFEPAIRYQAMNESRVRLSVIMRAKEFTDQDLVRHEFLKRLHRRYVSEGLALASQ